jgi:hypothetical protein
MDEAAQAREPGVTMPNLFCDHETALFHVPLRAADAARSAKNISLWGSYLPTACVRTMVRMGWDYTT